MIASILLSIHILVALAIVALVLIQHGKGADMGAAFGSGSAGSLFGSAGAANFLSRSTAVCATIFFITSLALTYFYAPKGAGGGVTSGITVPVKADAAKKEPVKDATKGAADAIPTPATTLTAPAGQASGSAPAAPANPQQIPK